MKKPITAHITVEVRKAPGDDVADFTWDGAYGGESSRGSHSADAERDGRAAHVLDAIDALLAQCRAFS